MNRHKLGSLAMATTLAMVVLTTTIAPPAMGDERARVLSGGLIDSSQLVSPVVLTGTLYGLDNSPVGSGNHVYLVAWPAKLANAVTVQVTAVAMATTDAHGEFKFRYSDPSSLARFATRGGFVNLDVQSTAGGVPSDLSVSLPAPSADTVNPSGAAIAEATASAPEVSVHPVVGAQPLASSKASALAGPQICAPSGPGTSLGVKQVKVGEAYTVSGATATLTYSSGSSSMLGTATSTSGTTGTFSASGSMSWSSDVSETMTALTSGGRQWTTGFVYTKYLVGCQGAGSYYVVKPSSFAGGAHYVSNPTPSASYCVGYSAGSNYEKTTTNAVKFAAGVGISSSIGIDLTAQTGFSTSTSLKFVFSKALQLCGTAGYPGSTPSRLVAKS